MSLMVSPVVVELVTTLEHGQRVARGERRCRALATLESPTPHVSRRTRLQAWLGGTLIAAGEHLRRERRLEPAAG
jgi:hypothetical protein